MSAVSLILVLGLGTPVNPAGLDLPASPGSGWVCGELSVVLTVLLLDPALAVYHHSAHTVPRCKVDLSSLAHAQAWEAIWGLRREDQPPS